MRRSLIAICGFALAIFLVQCALAQDILPGSLPGWNSAKAMSATSANLQAIAGVSTPALIEYGATAAEQKIYALREDPRRTFIATVYSFQDASGAYGAYSFLRTPDMAPAKYSEFSSRTRNRALVLVGSTLLDVNGNDLTSESAIIKKLAASLETQTQQVVYPSLPMRLPRTDLIPRTDHYFLGPIALVEFWPGTSEEGDWVGFSSGAEAETAKYRLGGRDATLLVVDYPTPQIAASQVEKMKKQFSINSPDAHEGGLFARRDGSLVAMVSGAPSAAVANSLLDKIESGIIVTWNEPVAKPGQPSIAAIVVGTIVGTGEICLFTIVGGVVFTIIRLGVKRVLPGRIFDRPQQFEILQMGLSSKPIKAKDFY
ncbi:MAG TPA: DUF6599 family protein [Candidatus Acidoferrales bacterium]|nr:DUF6599 family protein [Candidatus Acidoferrales bacterium]